MSSSQKYTLDNLASRANEIKSKSQTVGSYNGTTPQVAEREVTTVSRKPQWGGLTWLIILALIIGVLLFLFRPDLVLSTNQTTGEKYLDWGKLILWTLVFALIIVLLIWLTRGAHGMIETETVKYA